MLQKLFCAWCAVSNSTLLNIEWPDGNSQYYGSILNTTNFSIKGFYPNSRYFSFELYSLDTWEPFWNIYDKQIPGENNPYNNNEIYKDNLPYEIDVSIDATESYVLLYRIYLGVDVYGGVRLPSIYVDDIKMDECSIKSRPVIDIQNTDPDYFLDKASIDNNFYPPLSKKNLFINADAKYMIAFYNKTEFNYAKIVTKLPTIPKRMNSAEYQVRYFSFSTVDLSEPKQTIQTLADIDLIKSEYLTLYVYCLNGVHGANVIMHLEPPATTNNTCMSKILNFGILYRQLLPNFANEIPNRIMSRYMLNKTMEDYYPQIYWH
jgi:hypothetical protein